MVGGVSPEGAPKLVHSSLAVNDLDRAVEFYREAFGAEVLFSDYGMTDLISRTAGLEGLTSDLAQLTFPGSEHVVELIAFHHIPAGRDDDAPVRVGHGHVCFDVGDLGRALATARALGAVPVGEIVDFPGECRAIYMREPAGSVFELSEPYESNAGGST